MDGEQRQRVDRTRLIGIYLMLAGVLAIVLAAFGVSGAGAGSGRHDHWQEYGTTTTGPTDTTVPETSTTYATTTTKPHCGCKTTTTTVPETTTT